MSEVRGKAEEIMTKVGMAEQKPGSGRPGRPAFPIPDEAMFHGLAGEIVNAIDPYTEACRAAVLISLLSGGGAMIGRGPHVFAGLVRHPPSIWGLLVGGTSLGAKGSAHAAARMFLRAAYPEFMRTNVLPSLSSGEGLIHRVRDESEKQDKDGCPLDEGVRDKRLWVVVPEFRTVIAQTKRDSNTLSPVLRDAWDSPDLLSVPNRGENALCATEPHIAMMGHVTPGEFRGKVDPNEIAGGSLNRYLIFASRESKDLPEEKEFPEEDLWSYGKRLREVIDAARGLGNRKISKTAAGQALWVACYRGLKNPTGAMSEEEEGVLASVVTRARPHVLRLALTYALLDGRQIIDEEHLIAALAVWRYALDSARWLFRAYGVDPELVRLRAFIDGCEAGRTRAEITNDCFGRRATATPLDDLLARLGDGYEECSIQTAGRPRTVYRRKPMEKAE